MIKKNALLSVIFVFLSSNYNYGMEEDKLACFKFFIIHDKISYFCVEGTKHSIKYHTSTIGSLFNQLRSNKNIQHTFKSKVKLYNNRDEFVKEEDIKINLILTDNSFDLNCNKKITLTFPTNRFFKLLTDKLIVKKIQDNCEEVNTSFNHSSDMYRCGIKSCTKKQIDSYDDRNHNSEVLNEEYPNNLLILINYIPNDKQKKNLLKKRNPSLKNIMI